MKSPEHIFQSWTDRFIDRAVLPPMWTTGIDKAHRDMRNIGRVMSIRARGIKDGVPDVYVLQDGKACHIELKFGRNKPDDGQIEIMETIRRCGGFASWATDIEGVLNCFIMFGLRLHGNAHNIAREMQARCDADIAGRHQVKPKAKPRSARPPPSAVARAERNRLLPR